jgi:glycosyltransferase involved in cell wall biosynthesis
MASAMEKLGFHNAEVRRLASRRLPPEIVGKTKAFARPNWGRFLTRPSNDPANALRAELRWQCELGKRMAHSGFGKAQWLHAFLDEFPTLMIAAKETGIKVVSEIYILLSADRLVREERGEFPGWEPESPDVVTIINQEIGEHALISRSDYALCPSEAVQEDIVTNFGFPRDRTFVVPYGVSESWFKVRNKPIRGRVLFAGAADLRKGIQYLGLAAEKLSRSGTEFEFRVAGNVQPQVMQQTICRHLNFLGRVPRSQTPSEFEAADVFVLPSLAEGSAGVTYEALAAGVPVITTRAAGSVVRDGVEGRIVPERDPAALATAIQEIVEDRVKRDRMAHAARDRACEYTWERYGNRLVTALQLLAA